MVDPTLWISKLGERSHNHHEGWRSWGVPPGLEPSSSVPFSPTYRKTGGPPFSGRSCCSIRPRWRPPLIYAVFETCGYSCVIRIIFYSPGFKTKQTKITTLSIDGLQGGAHRLAASASPGNSLAMQALGSAARLPACYQALQVMLMGTEV